MGLRLAVSVLVICLPLCGSAWVENGNAESASTSSTVQTPYSVQPHVHSSFSEGAGSIASQTYVAVDAGLDVIWWSDHDWRMTYYHHASSFSFEDWSEPLSNNEPWRPNRAREILDKKELKLKRYQGFYVRNAEITDIRAYEGQRSLRLEGMSGQESFSKFYFRFSSDRQRYKRSLASNVSVDLAIFPEVVGADARAGVEILLSRQPPNEFIPGIKQYKLHYFLDNDLSQPYREGWVYHIPLPYVENEWNAYSLPVTQDAVEGFPFINGEDNSLYQVAFGLESRQDGYAVAYFDAFLINHELEGNELFQKQRQMLDDIQRQIPEVKQLQGTEISYELPHLNEFSVGTRLYDYDELAALSGYVDENGWITNMQGYQDFVARYVVERAQARGGVVSYNHPFGTSSPGSPPTQTKEELLEELYGNRLYGADLLEVGYRHRGGHSIEDHLWVWDELAKRQIYVVGDGSSDSHGGHEGNWQEATNNFCSWVYAHTPEKEQLIEGMKRGLVFFGDIGQFDGELMLSTPNGFQMGQVVITDKLEEEISISIQGLLSGDTVKIIEYGVSTRTYIAEGSAFERAIRAPIDGQDGTFVRIEVHNAGGREKVYSNPIYFIRRPPPEGISPFKAAIDLGGIFSTLVSSFTVTDAYLTSHPGCVRLTISGTAEGGEIVLDCSAFGSPEEVEFAGLSGTWSYEDSLLTLSELVSTVNSQDLRLPTLWVYFPDSIITSAREESVGEESLPREYSLSQNFPNPFNVSTVISYQLPADSWVKLEVYNLLGQKVAILVDERQQAGYKSVVWNASTVSSGLYFYKLTAGGFTATRRMMLAK